MTRKVLRYIANRLPYLKNHMAYHRRLEARLADKAESEAVAETLRADKEKVLETYRDKVRANFLRLDASQASRLKNILTDFFTARSGADYLKTEHGKKDFSDHFEGRLNDFRSTAIPWLESLCALKGCSVLEIGCGTGASTAALCEQGASVRAVDIDERSLEMAKNRLEIYGLQAAQLACINATDIKIKFGGTKFDFVIFWASLEHMTYPERIRALRAANSLLRPEGCLAVVDTPNRLWIEDLHTALCPFFHWLPDELAVDYARFTKRRGFNETFENNKNKGGGLLPRICSNLQGGAGA